MQVAEYWMQDGVSKTICKLWRIHVAYGARIPVLQIQRGRGSRPLAPQPLLCILEQLPDLLVREVLVRHVGEWCWVVIEKK
jgi:hypothetical protein